MLDEPRSALRDCSTDQDFDDELYALCGQEVQLSTRNLAINTKMRQNYQENEEKMRQDFQEMRQDRKETEARFWQDYQEEKARAQQAITQQKELLEKGRRNRLQSRIENVADTPGGRMLFQGRFSPGNEAENYSNAVNYSGKSIRDEEEAGVKPFVEVPYGDDEEVSTLASSISTMRVKFTAAALQEKTVVQLKAILKDYGVKVKGYKKKAELIQRIMDVENVDDTLAKHPM